MKFNGIEKTYLTVLRGRKRPAWAPINRELITVSGMSGAHLSHSKRQVRQITVPVFLMAESFSDLQKIKEDMAEWLIHDEAKELIFKDEPDRTYYALVDGGLDLDELVRWGQGDITFICPDPYKYGPEETYELEDITTIENKGTAPADPIFELTAKEKTTFAMISNGADEDAEYNLIGTPADDDVQVVDDKELIFSEDGSTLSGWDKGTYEPSPLFEISGEMAEDEAGAGIRAKEYGTGERVHGPAIMKELPQTIQDFEVFSMFDIILERDIDNVRMQIDLFDENMDSLAMIGMRDNSRYENRRSGLARVGEYRGAGEGYLITENNYEHDNFGQSTFFHLTVKREGNKYTFKIGRWISSRLRNIITETYHDLDNELMGKLKYIQVFIGSFADRPKPWRLRINSLDVYELAEITEDITPYILYPEDKVTFDHKNEDILVNGEPRNDLKNFGGSFFKLKKGENELIVTPAGVFDNKVIYADKYL